MKDNDDLFAKSLKESLSNKIEESISDKEEEVATIDKNSVVSVIKERLEEGETQWDLLKRMVLKLRILLND